MPQRAISPLQLSQAVLPTRFGLAEVRGFRLVESENEPPLTIMAILLGSWQRVDVSCHVHSMCIFGDALGSTICDCGEQLMRSLTAMQSRGGGIILYLENTFSDCMTHLSPDASSASRRYNRPGMENREETFASAVLNQLRTGIDQPQTDSLSRKTDLVDDLDAETL